MWLELVSQYLQAVKDTDFSDELVEFIHMLWRLRQREGIPASAEDGQEDDSEVESEHDATFEVLKTKQPEVHQILCAVSRFCRSSFLFTGNTSEGLPPL